MAEGSHHAIVFGASGLIGWALVDQLLGSHPYARSVSKVTAVTNRPLNLSQTYWPEPNGRRELQLVSGIDLRRGDGPTLAESLLQKVKDIRTVTHIYYLGMSLAASKLTRN
jgi:nucleoside-diphosphate-sugar epimerase